MSPFIDLHTTERQCLWLRLDAIDYTEATVFCIIISYFIKSYVSAYEMLIVSTLCYSVYSFVHRIFSDVHLSTPVLIVAVQYIINMLCLRDI